MRFYLDFSGLPPSRSPSRPDLNRARSLNRFDRRESSRVDESGGVVVLEEWVVRVGVASAEKSLLPAFTFSPVSFFHPYLRMDYCFVKQMNNKWVSFLLELNSSVRADGVQVTKQWMSSQVTRVYPVLLENWKFWSRIIHHANIRYRAENSPNKIIWQ